MSDNYMPFELANKTVKNYCCCECWGQLIMSYDRPSKLWHVHCLRCGDKNFVTKAYARQRETDSITEAQEVRHLYPQLMPKYENALKDLGF